MAKENPSIVRTPLVMAMWDPMAQAHGYPNKSVAFEDQLRVAEEAARAVSG